jgi:hypothetical protein
MHCILDLLRQSYTLPFKFEYLKKKKKTVPLNSLQLYAQPLLGFEVLILGSATLAVRTDFHTTFAISSTVTNCVEPVVIVQTW